MARKSTQPKRPRNAAWFKEKAMLAEAHKSGQILDEEQLAFLADPGITDCYDVQPIIIHNVAFQTDDLDAYDSDCDDISSVKAVLMANLSNYDSDILFGVPNFEPYLHDMDNQSVQAMQHFEHRPIDDSLDNKITRSTYQSKSIEEIVNGKNAYELKGKFLDDLHNNAFSGTNGKDAVEHIEYYLNIIDPIKLPNVDHDKLRVIVFPTSLAGGARRWFDSYKESITCWKMSGDEIEVSDDESFDLKEYWSNTEETAGNFKIETDVFDYETPLCLAFNEFNYLLKVDPDLLTKDILGFKTSTNGIRMYHGYMTSHGLIMEYGRNQNQSNILASLSTIKLDVPNGQPVVRERMVIVMEEIFPVLTILETRSITKTLNEECENETHDEGHEICSIKTREVPVCQIKRYKMIKYSFNDEEEYVAIKEDEYNDLTITSEEACRAYQEIFRMMDEGWKDLGSKEISTNIGGEFTNLEILKCWSLETSRRLFNTILLINSTWRIYRANIRGVSQSNSF
ncbi:hypothetical protein Tco_0731272 [Tanacetum coccineum]